MCVAEEEDEGRWVRAEVMHATWFTSSVEVVVATVATTTMGAASSAPATASVTRSCGEEAARFSSSLEAVAAVMVSLIIESSS